MSDSPLAGTTVMILTTDEVRPNPDQPRRLFDQDKLKQLAASIKQEGLLQPIAVRPVEDHYQIVAGERRWRAHVIAGIDTIEAVVLDDVGDQRAFELATMENVSREDMTVIEEADAFASLEALGRTHDELAEMFGKTPSYVKWRIDLLALSEDVKELVARGQIKTNLAWYIAKLAPHGQRQVVRKYANGDFRDEREAQAYAQAMYVHEQQGQLTSDGLSEEDREQRRQTRRRARTATQRLDDLASALGPFLESTPQKMYEGLEGELSTFYRKLELISKALNKVKRTARQARAIASAIADDGGTEHVIEEGR